MAVLDDMYMGVNWSKPYVQVGQYYKLVDTYVLSLLVYMR